MAKIRIKDHVLNEYYVLLTQTADKSSQLLIIKYIRERINEIKYKGVKLKDYIEYIERS